MSEKHFDPETARYIIDYMNQNHPASVYWYARTYGNHWNAEDASLLAIDKEGMDLQVKMPDGETQVRILFDHLLVDDEDAQNTLIEMSMQARARIMSRTGQQQQRSRDFLVEPRLPLVLVPQFQITGKFFSDRKVILG